MCREFKQNEKNINLLLILLSGILVLYECKNSVVKNTICVITFNMQQYEGINPADYLIAYGAAKLIVAGLISGTNKVAQGNIAMLVGMCLFALLIVYVTY